MNRKEYSHMWYLKNKKRILIERKEYRKNHIEKYKEYGRIWYQKNKNKIKEERKNYQLNYKYGITKADFNNLLLAQNNKCLICGQPLDLTNPHNVHIDHSHKRGVIRGILCANCNKAIGFLKDNPEYVYNAYKYLKERDSK